MNGFACDRTDFSWSFTKHKISWPALVADTYSVSDDEGAIHYYIFVDKLIGLFPKVKRLPRVDFLVLVSPAQLAYA